MRGGVLIGLGILAGNVLGFVRSAVTAYLLGTHSAGDAVAVSMAPIDTLNGVLINTMVFAFVPVLTMRQGCERAMLFQRMASLFRWVFCSVSAAMILFAPWLVDVLGPGLAPSVYSRTVGLMRISALTIPFVGAAALHSALLYTEQRFGPPAFYQACVNIFVIAGALAFWRSLGIYGFAIGYVVGGVAQYVVVWAYSHRGWRRLMDAQARSEAADHTTAELLSKPGAFLLYAGLISLNAIVTRRYATEAGPGMAAAFDYCSRAVNVVVAYLISPVSNTLLPEVARLRSEGRSSAAFRLIRRTLAIVGAFAVVSCTVLILLRQPVFAILFQRGNFTAESTMLVSEVFLGFAPSLVGWSLLEIVSRSLFALNRPWLPVIAAAVPVTVNLAVSSALHSFALHTGAAEKIGWGASIGQMAGFAFLAMLLWARGKRTGSVDS